MKTRHAFALAFALILTSFSACQKQPTSGYGTQTSYSVVEKAINEATSGQTELNMYAGDQVLVDHTELIGANPEQATGDTLYSVIDRSEDSQNVNISLMVQDDTYTSSGKTLTVTKHYQLQFCKDPGSATCPNAPATPPDPSLSFYNLKIQKTTMTPPDAVRTQPNCLNIPNCLIHVTNVSFDKVTWHKGQSQKETLEYTFSTDVPFLANVLRRCDSGVVVFGSGAQRVPQYVQICDKVADWRYGKKGSQASALLWNQWMHPSDGNKTVLTSDSSTWRDPLTQVLDSLSAFAP